MKRIGILAFWLSCLLGFVTNVSASLKFDHVYANPRTDVAFKILMGNSKAVISIVNCMVPDFKEDKVTEVTPLNPGIPEQPGPGVGQVIMDYHAKTQNGDDVIIEMQQRRDLNIDERFLYYACGTYAGQLSSVDKSSEKWYYGLKKVYAINFLDYDSNAISGIESCAGIKDTLLQRVKLHTMKENCYVKHYKFVDVNSEQALDAIQMIQIELPRADKILDLKRKMKSLETKARTSVEESSSSSTSTNDSFSEVFGSSGDDLIERGWLAVFRHSGEITPQIAGLFPSEVKDGLKTLALSSWNAKNKENYAGDLEKLETNFVALADAKAQGMAIGKLQSAMQVFYEEGKMLRLNNLPAIRFDESELRELWNQMVCEASSNSDSTESAGEKQTFNKFLEELKDKYPGLIRSYEG